MPMDADQPTEELSSGPEEPRGRLSRPLVIATAVALVAAGGVGVAAAASTRTPPSETPTTTETPTPTPTETPTDPPTSTPVPELAPLDPRGFAGAMHGEFTVATKDGCETVTLLAQTGQATAVAADSITVRSQDGFERTYAISDTTRTFAGRKGDSEVRQDDWVSVTATTDGQNATAVYVYDLSRPGKRIWSYQGWKNSWQWWAGPPRWQTPTPCPTPTVTPTATPTEPTPTITEPTPTVTEPTPTITEPNPTVSESITPGS